MSSKKRDYPKEVVSRLESLDERLKVDRVGDISRDDMVYPIYCVRASAQNPDAGTVFLSAGIHGHEPAGVYALLEFLEKDIHPYLADFNFIAFPCLNPYGFENNLREDIDGINLNRNFMEEEPAQAVHILKQFLAQGPEQYLFAWDMHEDNTDRIVDVVDGFSLSDNPKTFYLYEISRDRESSIGHKILEILESTGITICKRPKIYYEHNDNGLIWSRGMSDPNYVDGDTLEGYIENYTNHVFNPETPTCWPLETRVAAQIQALSAALDIFKAASKAHAT